MQLAAAEGLTTARLHEITGRPLQSVLSSLRHLQRLGYVDSAESTWSIRQAGRTALELARGAEAHLELDLRTIAGVSVTAYDAGKGVHRVDLRRCPVPFRHLAFKWIESLYGTSDEPVRSSTVKNAATWVFIVLRFYADHYSNDDDLRHLDADVVREWVCAVLPHRQPTRDAYLDHVGRRLAVFIQFCEWIQMQHPSFLPPGLVPATIRRAGVSRRRRAE